MKSATLSLQRLLSNFYRLWSLKTMLYWVCSLFSSSLGFLSKHSLILIENTFLKDYDERQLTLMTPLGTLGSSHWTTTVLELTGRARTFLGGLPGAARVHPLSWRSNTLGTLSIGGLAPPYSRFGPYTHKWQGQKPEDWSQSGFELGHVYINGERWHRKDRLYTGPD